MPAYTVPGPRGISRPPYGSFAGKAPPLTFLTTVYPRLFTLGFGSVPAGNASWKLDAYLLLGGSANILSATVQIVTEPGFPATDTNPASRLSGAPHIIASAIIQNLAGLILGNVYKLTCYMVDSAGMQWQFEYRLVCGTLH